MSSTTMHFGPEWMRTKHQTPTRAQPPPSPPPTGATSGASTYSALVSPVPPTQLENRDEAHPFRYSKEELLQIYKEGGGRGGLGLEVERWEGVVREVGGQPIGLREMGEAEKKLFQGPLNSDLRRRQSTDYLSPLSTQTLGNDRSRISLNSPGSTMGSPLRDRFGALRRRDSADQPSIAIPRKQSLSNLQPASPRDIASSPRRGSGYTPSFDGILGGGDSWVARRRASEASLKSGTNVAKEGGPDYHFDSKASDIREEEEEANRESEPPHNLDMDISTHHANKDNLVAYDPDASADMARLSFGTNGATAPESLTGLADTRLTSAITDPASMEWSYKDPSGQIQGPFNAELMQKWFDDGYFAGDLPMRRTHVDVQWVTVDELVRRHGGGKIFLAPPLPVIPPGLTHRNSQNFAQDPLLLNNGPYQPAPVRNLRSSTLDTFGSNASDSPSSSFGAARFGNASPDPNAFGGRGAIFGDNTVARQNFTAIPDAVAFNRRTNFNDIPLDPSSSMRSPAFGNVNPGRGPNIDGLGFNRAYSPGQAWNAASFDGPNVNRLAVDSYSSPFGPGVPPHNFGNIGASQDAFSDAGSFQNVDYSPYLNGPSQPQHYSASPAPIYQQPISYGLQNATPQTVSSDVNSSPALSQSLWNETLTSRRPGPFEAILPTSTNTIAQPVTEASPWGSTTQPPRPSSQTNESSPWLLSSSQGLADDSWKMAPVPDSLTFNNVGQHNQQQQQLVNAAVSVADKAGSSEASIIIPIVDTSPTPDLSSKAAPSGKPKGKSAAQASQPTSTAKTTSPALQVISEPAPAPAILKAAWSKEDESKPKASGTSISLREIQEAEAKKLEARKAAEREKERAARAAAPAPDFKDTAQAFTASWGLPTSQAGARTSIPMKDPTPASSPVTAPVWTNAPKVAAAKKSMKEIQEEEEKRKKTAAKESVASAVRRAYADTTQKVTPPIPQGNPWTTIGPSGKPTTPAAPSRPTVATSNSNLSVLPPTRPNGASAPRPTSVSPVTKTVPATSKNDDPVPPSHDFVKWLSGSLKGLNSSVNIEEIMQMLLSFSIDPDTTTIELISDLIYANSTTLDGRRFAAEYVSKRKADAASRPKGVTTAGKTPSKPVSIADVVKAAPKPTQPEWGFKVVNKKKKGGRA